MHLYIVLNVVLFPSLNFNGLTIVGGDNFVAGARIAAVCAGLMLWLLRITSESSGSVLTVSGTVGAECWTGFGAGHFTGSLGF